MRTAGWLAGLLAIACMAPMARAQSIDPAFVPEGAAQYEKGRNRGLDQLRHPEFQQMAAPTWSQALTDPATLAIDPYRLGWSRGETRNVTVPNRYGTPMHGVLYGPKPSALSTPLPAVIVLTGGNGPQEGQWAWSQGLAEAGYVVLGLDVQGDGRSPAAPPDPDPSTPANEYCKPHNHGGWQDPQELGISEPGECAGQAPAPTGGPEAALTAAIDANSRAIGSQEPDYRAIEAYYRTQMARKTFGALDAATWLLSSDNPWRSRIDGARLGVTGFSLGAHGALLAGNGDPLRRFSAAVSLDSYGPIEVYQPAVPTMFQAHELDLGVPKHHRPDDTATPSYRDYQRFHAAGVPVMRVVPDGSTHADFSFVQYVPFWVGAATVGLCPDCIPSLNSSRDGERVSLYYAQAWFDRFLKGAATSAGARARLLARTFDDSVDGSSIGQGTWDPLRGNVPYTIGGETVHSHLSPLLGSFAAFDGVDCDDLRAGC